MNLSPDLPAKPVILVVDDTPDNLLLMANLLKDSYTVKAANNGEKALRIARDTPPPDLILLDIMMPGMTGHDVARACSPSPTHAPFRSSSSPRWRPPTTRRAAWKWARPTTSPSQSARPSCWRACAPS
jgi:CheY-like chemotaxis protein